MSVIDQAKAHYAGLGSFRAEIPEWGEDGNPVIVTWSPLTLAEKRKAMNGAKSLFDQIVMVRIVIAKACDEDGNKLFTPGDEQTLMTNVAASIVERLALDIVTVPSAEEQEKN